MDPDSPEASNSANREPRDPPGEPSTASPGFFDRVLAACRDPSFYHRPLREPLRRAVGYALRLLVILGVLWGIVAAYHNWSRLQQVVETVQPQLSPITFRNGVLQVEGEVPRRIRLMDDRVLIIDPDGTLVRERLDREVVAVWVNRALFVRLVPDEFYSFSTRLRREDADAPEVRITGENLHEWVQDLKWIVLPLWALLGAVGVMIEGSLLIVMMSVGGLFARPRAKREYTWNDLLKLACYVATPVLLVQYTAAVVGLPIPYAFSLFLAAGALGVYWLVLKLDRPPAPQPHAGEDPLGE